MIESEYCDDGDLSDSSKCNSNCTAEVKGWYCKGGNISVSSTCNTLCGDGILAGNETCDDGNFKVMDGCEPDCLESFGWSCNNNICTEICGDG